MNSRKTKVAKAKEHGTQDTGANRPTAELATCRK